MFHVEQGKGKEDAAEGCSLLVAKENQKSVALRGESFCLPQAGRDAPLGQRQGGVFRLPPPFLWTPPTPQRAKGCSPLTIPKEMGSIQKIQVAPLKDFLCSANFESLARRNVRATACFHAGANAPAGSQRQQMTFFVTTPFREKSKSKTTAVVLDLQIIKNYFR